MRKYAFVTCGSTELSEKVQKELFRVGFKARYGITKPDLLENEVIFVDEDGYLQWWSSLHNFLHYNNDYELINPYYVLEHAIELESAKKPHEIAEPGYRIATADELLNAANGNYCSIVRIHHINPISSTYHWHATCFFNNASDWAEFDIFNVAVPVDYVFPRKDQVKVVCEGKTVFISKDDAQALNLID